jgi:membrane-associated phospholipid phosphatase
MFQTDIIRFLQSFASDWLTALMLVVSAVGSLPFHLLVLSVVLLGVDLRKGIVLAHMLLWTSALTDQLKVLLGLPRPLDVDPRVLDLTNVDPSSSGSAMRGVRRIQRAVVEAFDSSGAGGYGFPSGHLSSTITVWGGLSVLLNNAGLRLAAVLLVLLMAVSRMYLGRHFPADVLGGFVLGSVIVFTANRLAGGGSNETDLGAIRGEAWGAWGLAYLLLVPCLIALAPWTNARFAGQILGIDAAYVALLFRGLPSESGSLVVKVTRVLLGLVLYLGARLLLTRTASIFAAGRLIEFGIGVAAGFVLVWGTIWIGRRMGIYETEPGRVRTDGR